MAGYFLGLSCTVEAALSRHVPPSAKKPLAVAEMINAHGY